MNIEDTNNIRTNPADEISVIDILIKIGRALKYLNSKRIIILSFSLFGAILGLGYSILKKPTYTAVCTFVLEDAKGGGGLGQYAGLASLAGINIGGNGGGIFQGDNILELYTSRLMIEKALLKVHNFNGKKEILINRLIDSYKFRNSWNNENGLDKIEFYGKPESFNRIQDSIITDLTDFINKKILKVNKPDKKLSIILVEVESKDELFSKFFTEELVQNVNDFYVQTKTKKANQNLIILQRQADSVRAILNSSLSGAALAIDAAPNLNPQMQLLRVNSQKKEIDVQANKAIYSEIVKNLEIEKISFRQEMPLIQVIDKPILPLKKNKVNKIAALFIGAIIGDLILLVFFCSNRLIYLFKMINLKND